jgi:hypothetical protein
MICELPAAVWAHSRIDLRACARAKTEWGMRYAERGAVTVRKRRGPGSVWTILKFRVLPGGVGKEVLSEAVCLRLSESCVKGCNLREQWAQRRQKACWSTRGQRE